MRYWPFILFLFLSILVKAQKDVTPALEIIKSCIDYSAFNNPLEALNTFQYNSYENLKIAGNPEAITGSGYKKTELRRTLLKTGVFLSEKTLRLSTIKYKAIKSSLQPHLCLALKNQYIQSTI